MEQNNHEHKTTLELIEELFSLPSEILENVNNRDKRLIEVCRIYQEREEGKK